jgi:hypothetical protein
VWNRGWRGVEQRLERTTRPIFNDMYINVTEHITLCHASVEERITQFGRPQLLFSI